LDLEVLKKKLSSFRSENGKITKVSDELAVEILLAWEQWTGPASGFYSGLGADHRKMASILGKAKKLKRDGMVPVAAFTEVKIVDSGLNLSASNIGGVEMAWENGRLIRFSGVPQLIEFLIKYPQSQTEIREVKKAG
jgi:hypothetical protein